MYRHQANTVVILSNNQLYVSDGPDTPVIMGPWLNLTSQNVTLTCTASSQPPSTYTWLFNGSQVATGSVYESGPLTSHNNGEFTCMAFNNITNKNSTASQKLTVIGEWDETTTSHVKNSLRLANVHS